jgi:hypothetical protein
MERLSQYLIAVTILFSFILIPGSLAFGQSAEAEKAIKRRLDLLEECFLKEDIDMWSDVVSDSFALVMKDGRDPNKAHVFNRAQTLRGQVNRWAKDDFVEHKHTDVNITVKGPIATSVSTVTDRTKAGKTTKFRIFHIWVDEGDAWRLVFSTTLLADDR